jgi:argininosuccinate lyase
MLSTGVSLWLRSVYLAFFEDLLIFRQALLELASHHVETVIPIYTHGVQAQPTSLAHYVLGFLAGLDRGRQGYRRFHSRQPESARRRRRYDLVE